MFFKIASVTLLAWFILGYKAVQVALSGALLFISALGVFKIYVLSNATGTWQMVSSNFVIDLPSGIGI